MEKVNLKKNGVKNGEGKLYTFEKLFSTKQITLKSVEPSTIKLNEIVTIKNERFKVIDIK